MLKAAVAIPVIASSGAGAVGHFSDVFASTKVPPIQYNMAFHNTLDL